MMTRHLYTIQLTATEARLCRDAAKAEGETFFPGAGKQTFERGQWWDIAKWLERRAADIECRIELSTRKQSIALVDRIEFALAGGPTEIIEDRPAKADAVAAGPKQKSLFEVIT